MSSSLADKWTFLDRFIQRLRYRQVIRFIPQGAVLADLGCGSGDFLRYMSKRISFGYGVDIMIKSSDAGQNLLFHERDLNAKIPLDDASMDVVSALAVLEHLRDPVAFLAEVLRVLRPGGHCIVTTPAPAAKPLLELLAFKFKIISEKDIRDHKDYYGRDRLNQLFSAFEEVRIEHFQFGLNTIVIARKASFVINKKHP